MKKFNSKWTFILACVGSSVGMANIWGFPYRVIDNGGGAFLIPYFIFIILFSYFGLSTEYAVGRWARTGALGTYRKVWSSQGKEKVASFIGWIPLMGSLCIALGYAVIVAYALKALLACFTGELMAVDSAVWFESFSGQDFSVVFYHLAIILLTLFTLILGVTSIEKSNKIIMPIFFILFVVLAVRVAMMDGASEGYKFLFTSDWEKLSEPMTWINAMGQAFFSLSVIGAGMIVYGSYLGEDEDVLEGAKWTAAFDTIAAMVAALVMIPAAFSYNLVELGGGPALLFIVLPTILQNIPFGSFFGVIFFTAVVFAGISSLQNMLEVVAESIMRKHMSMSRTRVLVYLFIICFGIGVFMEPISKWGPWMDIVSIYISPIGAMIGSISWFWVMKKEDLLMAMNTGAKKTIGDRWYKMGKYIYVPMTLILCTVAIVFGISF